MPTDPINLTLIAVQKWLFCLLLVLMVMMSIMGVILVPGPSRTALLVVMPLRFVLLTIVPATPVTHHVVDMSGVRLAASTVPIPQALPLSVTLSIAGA